MAFFFCFNSFGSCGIIAAEKGGAGGEEGLLVQLGGPKAACATCPPQVWYNRGGLNAATVFQKESLPAALAGDCEKPWFSHLGLEIC